MIGPDKRRQSLYFPEDMMKEIEAEATRQDRSLSWLIQKAWIMARGRLKQSSEDAALSGGTDKGGLE